MWPSPDTFLIQTRDGTLGLVQIEETDKAPGKLTVTWRAVRGAGARGGE